MSVYNFTGDNISVLEQIAPNTIVVAAFNSSEENKQIAKYICDGFNDEEEINSAINDLYETGQGGTVFLCKGDYTIGSLLDTGDTNIGKVGIYIKTDKNLDISLVGSNHPNRISTDWSITVGNTANIKLSDALFSSLSDDEIVSIIAPYGGRNYPNLNFEVRNIAINLQNNNKAVTMINGYYASNMRIDYFFGSIKDGKYETVNTAPNEKCRGIAVLQGQNFGTGYYINNCFIWGQNVAYDLGGEHLIMQNCGCRLCNIPFRFNAIGSEALNSHPITLINCCAEACKSGMYFKTSTSRQAVTIIDYNEEYRATEQGGRWARTVGAVEETPGSFCGTVTYAINKESYVNVGDVNFWEPGSGLNFVSRNLAHKLIGASSDRPQAPNIMQQYFDTTLNKMLVHINGAWVDFNGNSV